MRIPEIKVSKRPIGRIVHEDVQYKTYKVCPNHVYKDL